MSSLDCHLRVLMIPWTLNTEEHFLQKLLSLSRMIKSILVETSNLRETGSQAFQNEVAKQLDGF